MRAKDLLKALQAGAQRAHSFKASGDTWAIRKIDFPEFKAKVIVCKLSHDHSNLITAWRSCPGLHPTGHDAPHNSLTWYYSQTTPA